MNKDSTGAPAPGGAMPEFARRLAALFLSVWLASAGGAAFASGFDELGKEILDGCVKAVEDKTGLGVYASALCECARGELVKAWPTKEREKIASVARKLDEDEDVSSSDRALLNRFLESVAKEQTVGKCYRTVMSSGR